MSDTKIRFHVIHSVKGGCGKTSFSLKKCIELAEKEKVTADSKANVLYLDCDLRGSALKVLLYGFSKKSAIPVGVETSGKVDYICSLDSKISRFMDFDKKYEDCKTLSDFIMQAQQANLDDIIVHGCTYIDRDVVDDMKLKDTLAKKYNIAGRIDFIFSASNSNEKRPFSHTAVRSANDAVINIGLFRLRMRKLFRKILNYGKLIEGNPLTYTDVVLDMPPGSDEYSDALLREIRELADEKKEVEITYYCLTTMDRGHMYATADYIGELQSEIHENQKVCCVFSEMSENELGNDYEKLAKNFSDVIDNNEQFFEYSKEDWEYYANHFSKDYYETTHSGEAAIKLDSNISEIKYSNIHH